MPHALTKRQRAYLEFIRSYIKENESSPRLEEIAEHFSVSLPTAHRMLEALHNKGYLYFARDKLSGFFIRLIERAGSAEQVFEVAVRGRIDEWGEVLEFPGHYGHFATIVQGSEPENVFALYVSRDIAPANMLAQDFILFDMRKAPQPGDICIIPIGMRLFLGQTVSKTFDRDTRSIEMAQQYPIPENLSKPELGQLINWYPLAYDDTNLDYFLNVAEEQHYPLGAVERELVLATALRLLRPLSL